MCILLPLCMPCQASLSVYLIDSEAQGGKGNSTLASQPARLMGCNENFSPEVHQFYQETCNKQDATPL